MPIASVNPATGQVLKTFDALTPAQLDEKLNRARAAFGAHRTTSHAQRSAWLARAGQLLDDGKRRYGELLTTEMGKTLKQAIAEVEKCAWACRYYAENAERFLADEAVATDAARSFVRYQPLGVVLAIMPWNFPFWQVFRFAAPALAAGNVGLLKHASNVPQAALAIEDVLRQAGFAEGCFQTLLIGSDAVENVIADERVSAVTLTGSNAAGSSVAAAAGKHVKKSVLELGGSDPFVVLASADLDAAVATAVSARTINNGQSCIAAKRFIIQESIADEFERRFVERFKKLRVGDPMDEATDIGPLVNQAAVETLERQVAAFVKAGGRVLTGGKRIARAGFFYEATIIGNTPRDRTLEGEEIFGPVALVFRARDLADAVAIANETPFGLGASAWTRDKAEEERLISGIDAGSVFINGMVKSDPRLPFGGVKASGYGRELGVLGIREFVNAKAVWIGPAT
ncbi:MAG TPA: NAD-dependent succinate-semialdehyde dehydrogenase [Candidatus Tumulicola sp.]|nr:NAD-dependent succinate-semialdehyde dehydrogenase [Candidatus Tumulicola sp.]